MTIGAGTQIKFYCWHSDRRLVTLRHCAIRTTDPTDLLSISSRMEQRTPPPACDYWFPPDTGGPHAEILRHASIRAWPYAVYCATLYHRDIHVAHELMDHAVLKTAHYLARAGLRQPSAKTVSSHLLGGLKRLSKRRLRHHEILSGSFSDLELIPQHLARDTAQEESVYIRQLVSKMTPRMKQIFYWRVVGHTFREIAAEMKLDHATIVRIYNKEIRGLTLHRGRHTVTLSRMSRSAIRIGWQKSYGDARMAK